MRLIKFKLFRKGHKGMWSVDELHIQPEMETYAREIIPHSEKVITYTATEGEHIVSAIGEDNILLQSTGLKDRNNVEIYEGDVVKYTDELNRVNNYEVIYKGYGFILKGLTYTDGTKADKDFYQNMLHQREQEVIGNVWENPELAK